MRYPRHRMRQPLPRPYSPLSNIRKEKWAQRSARLEKKSRVHMMAVQAAMHKEVRAARNYLLVIGFLR